VEVKEDMEKKVQWYWGRKYFIFYISENFGHRVPQNNLEIYLNFIYQYYRKKWPKLPVCQHASTYQQV
jgi:hypothetical protein